jgi:hypothetical protein
MNTEKVIFAFFIVLALTLNFSFFLGDIDNPDHHNVYGLFGAILVSIIATVMKLGDRTHVGAILIATSLVADLQLIFAAMLWGATHVFDTGMTPALMASIVSLSAGAFLANLTSVVLLIVEAITLRH